VVYVQKIIDAIQKAEHVVDVFVGQDQGIYVAQYDSDNQLVVQDTDENEEPIYEMRVSRSFVPNAGFVKQSTGEDVEERFQKWAESITLVVEGQETEG